MTEENVRKPKVLILDVDYRTTGTSSIGSDEMIRETFGFPPMRIKSGENFQNLMERLGEMKDIETELGVENIYELNEPYNQADFIVLDSLTGLQTFMKKQIRGLRSTMTQQDWGKLGDMMQDYLTKLACSEKNVIVTIHSKFDKDAESGVRVEISALSGQTGDNIGQYFDILMYSIIQTSKSGAVFYKWQVVPSEKRNARSLPAITKEAMGHGGMLEQDYVKLFELIRKDTTGPIKIGVIGLYGTGKTYSLRSLVDVKL